VNSRLGHLCRSLQQNEELSASIGVNTAMLRVLAYAISSFFGGLAGAIFVAISQSIYPSSFVVQDSVNFMLYCFLGGLGYVFGPMLGTLLLYFGWDLSVRRQGIPASHLLRRADRADAGAAERGSQPSRQEGGPQMTPILQVKGVTKRYGGLTANNDISFDVAPQEILSVIGPNGAGKSTLFKQIAGFVTPTTGEVIYKGNRFPACRRTRWRGWGWCGPSRRRRSSSR
jgi:ABC-type multidrug transport system fused ATPase/permease subunit